MRQRLRWADRLSSSKKMETVEEAKMKAFAKTSLRKKLVFVAVLLAGVVIWKIGAIYLAQPEEAPYEIEKTVIEPI